MYKTLVSTPENQCIEKNHPAPDKPHSGSTEPQTYTYPLWDSDPERVAWLEAHEDSLVCILSVSLIRQRLGLTEDEMFNRKNILEEALEKWARHGWYCLVFIPHRNHKEYQQCLRIESRFGEHVRLASYEVYPDTCGKSMVVGESRNAILHFVLKYKHIFRTCTIADERIAGFWHGIKEVDTLKANITSEQAELVDKFRNKFGYELVKITKKAMGAGTFKKNSKTMFRNLEKSFNRGLQKLKKQLSVEDFEDYTFESSIYNHNNHELSLWHALQTRQPTLVGVAAARAGAFYATNEEPIREKTRKSEKIAQFACFAVGGARGWRNTTAKGWRGQMFYTRTTMMEDNVWAYNWDESKELGDVAEIYCVTAKRLRGLSLTRRRINLAEYSECALKELLKALQSNSYRYHNDRGGRVTMRWTTHSKGEALHLAEPEGEKKAYWHMASLIAGVADACRQKSIPVSHKVKQICQVLKRKLAPFLEVEQGESKQDDVTSEEEDEDDEEEEDDEEYWDYTVEKGEEKLSDIATHFEMDIGALVAQNKGRMPQLTKRSTLLKGTVLMFPVNGVQSDEEFFIIKAAIMKKVDSSTGVVLESTIQFGNGQRAETILKIFNSENIEKEFEITENAYRGTAVKLYYTAHASGAVKSFISEQIEELCQPSMERTDRKKLKKQMEFIAKRKKRNQKFGIMIMSNIQSFGKLYRHSYVAGRYPHTKILKTSKYMKQWQFNALHEILELHKKNIVHGDLNYGNVWILEEPASKKKEDIGQVFIIDFGESLLKEGASINDELEELPHSTKQERRYRKDSLPWKIRPFIKRMTSDTKLKKAYLNKFPGDNTQLEFEITQLNDSDEDSDEDSDMKIGTHVSKEGTDFEGKVIGFSKTRLRATVKWDNDVVSTHNVKSLKVV